jgi:hypothetical protein
MVVYVPVKEAEHMVWAVESHVNVRQDFQVKDAK